MGRRTQEFLERHPAVAVTGGEILLIFVVINDAARLRRAVDLHGTDVIVPIAVGVAVTVGLLATCLWYRAGFRALAKPVRRSVAWILTAAGVATFGSLLWFHPRHQFGTDTPSSSFAIANVAYTASLLTVAAGLLPLLLWHAGRRSDKSAQVHAPVDAVEVWHVRDRSKRGTPPYFIASCECGWTGTAHDESEPGAEAAAFADARGHGTKVRAELAYPMD